MSSELTISKTEVYNVKYFFKGRRIADESEPPADLIDDFIDYLADGITTFGWEKERGLITEHPYCTEDCAVEVCIAFGWPYTRDLRQALER